MGTKITVLLVILILESLFNMRLSESYGFDFLSFEIKEEEKSEEVEYIHFAFKQYNPNISIEIVDDFIKAIKAYNLCEYCVDNRTFVHQLLYESSGFHCKSGKLITSTAGAMGIAQIRPSTAFQYLRYEMDKNALKKLLSLGADSAIFDHQDVVVSKKVNGKILYITPEATKRKMSRWLENHTNSILLWAHIMSENSKKHGLDNALIIYNAGPGNWRHYVKNHSTSEHPYIKGIKRVENYLQQKKATI